MDCNWFLTFHTFKLLSLDTCCWHCWPRKKKGSFYTFKLLSLLVLVKKIKKELSEKKPSWLSCNFLTFYGLCNIVQYCASAKKKIQETLMDQGHSILVSSVGSFTHQFAVRLQQNSAEGRVLQFSPVGFSRSSHVSSKALDPRPPNACQSRVAERVPIRKQHVPDRWFRSSHVV
jgi:hypothetical protein